MRTGRVMDCPAGVWGACEECAPLVQQDDVEALLARAMKAYPSTPEKQLEQMTLFRALYVGFLKHRTGSPFYSEGDEEAGGMIKPLKAGERTTL